MKRTWLKALDRWRGANLIDDELIQRVKTYENQLEKNRESRWLVVVLWSFGSLMLAAGILLFVAAHWDSLSPAGRLAIVLSTLAAIHIAAAFLGTRQPLLGRILHAAGTLVLGGGIFLVAQIFHLEEHWPSGFMLWALGAWLAWAMLSDWIQLALAATLTPIWLVGEWSSATATMAASGAAVAGQGVLLLAITYFTALGTGRVSYIRYALVWIGGLVLIPSGIFLAAEGQRVFQKGEGVPLGLAVLGWTIAIGGPLIIAYLLRKERCWLNLIAAGWVLLFAGAGNWPVYQYALSALFCLFLVWWGFNESQRERINMGMAGFAITLLFFYFSNVMDKLGRSMSLVGLGILFLVLGWALLRFRRGLFKRLEEVES